MKHPRRLWTSPLVAFGVLTASFTLLAKPAPGQGQVSLQAKLGGHAAAGSKESHPLPLSAVLTPIELLVTNNTQAPIDVRTVRFSGSVLGLTFFAYETSVEVQVAPGSTEDRKFNLDLSQLKGQATGLIPASISVLDSKRHPLASQGVTVDIHGSKRSVYGIFGLMLLVLTGLGLGSTLLALAHQRLSENRWSRAVRFLLSGIGVGLVLVIGFSIFSVFAPRLSRWGPIVVISALVLFVVGYFTPTPEPDEEPWVPGLPPTEGAVATTAAGPAPSTYPPGRATQPSSATSTMPQRAPASAPATSPPGAPPAQ